MRHNGLVHGGAFYCDKCSLIKVDLNVRVNGNDTFSHFQDITGPMPEVGDDVFVYESNVNIIAPAVVESIDKENELIYLHPQRMQMIPFHKRKISIIRTW